MRNALVHTNQTYVRKHMTTPASMFTVRLAIPRTTECALISSQGIRLTNLQKILIWQYKILKKTRHPFPLRKCTKQSPLRVLQLAYMIIPLLTLLRQNKFNRLPKKGAISDDKFLNQQLTFEKTFGKQVVLTTFKKCLP